MLFSLNSLLRVPHNISCEYVKATARFRSPVARGWFYGLFAWKTNASVANPGPESVGRTPWVGFTASLLGKPMVFQHF